MKQDRIRQTLALLAEQGPMTCAEIRMALDIAQRNAAKMIGNLSHAQVRHPKRIYITAWVRDMEGQKEYPGRFTRLVTNQTPRSLRRSLACNPMLNRGIGRKPD